MRGAFSRERIMREAANLRGLELPTLLPGIRVDTSPTDYRPLRQLQLIRWDGRIWQRFGAVIDAATGLHRRGGLLACRREYGIVSRGGGCRLLCAGMLFLSDFANLGLVLPLAGLVGCADPVGAGEAARGLRLVPGDRRHPRHHGGAEGAGLRRGRPGGRAGLGNPSGHTAAGIVVYAGLLALLGERFAPRLNIALLAGPAFGLLFGLTRIELPVHTLADVLVGGAVGLGGVLVLAWLAGPRRADARAAGMPVVAAVALGAILAFHGHRLIAEVELRAIAAQLQSVGDRAFN